MRNNPPVPILIGDRIDLAKQMVQQLVEKGIKISQICEDTDLNRQTLQNLRNGAALRVTDRTYNRLRNSCWAEMNGKTASDKPVEEAQTALRLHTRFRIGSTHSGPFRGHVGGDRRAYREL